MTFIVTNVNQNFALKTRLNAVTKNFAVNTWHCLIKIREKFITLNKHIGICKPKFQIKDVCLNGDNCTERVKGFGTQQSSYKVDCKCPLKQSFKCDQYFCTRDQM